MRSLIQPPAGWGIAYLDWCQQEHGIAAVLSGDEVMQAAYLSGDPYLEFAKQAGAVPADATKRTHNNEREQDSRAAGLGVLSFQSSLCAMANAIVGSREAGVPVDDLPIVVMRDTIRGDDHTVAAARLDGHWLMLGNMRKAMIEDGYVRNYLPLFVIDQSGVMKYSEPPLLAGARSRTVDRAEPCD